MTIDFLEAIKQGDRDEVERLLNADAGLIHLRENGLSPIMIAAYHGEPEIASFLADKTVALTVWKVSSIYSRLSLNCLVIPSCNNLAASL